MYIFTTQVYIATEVYNYSTFTSSTPQKIYIAEEPYMVRHRGGSRLWKGGCTLLKRLKTKKKKRRSRMSKGSSNITMKLKYIIIIPFIVSQINYTAY